MNFYKIVILVVFTSVSSIASTIEYEDANNKFSEVGRPDEVFSGIYAGFGCGLDFIDNKYEIAERPAYGTTALNTVIDITQRKGSINLSPYNIIAFAGFGGVFNRFYYLGFETELFVRRGGKTKHNGGVAIEAKSTYGFNFKLRGGYIFRPANIMLYTVLAVDRSINNISLKLKDQNKYTGDESFGSYHPLIGLGVEKKLRNNWSLRAEASYTIGIWDDTGKRIQAATNVLVPFKARANKKSIKLAIVKYF